MKSVDVSIIIVNYNSTQDLIDCLHSINSQRVDLVYEVIVVDNNSCDKEYLNEWIKDKLQNMTVLFNETNIGFAAANNQGIDMAYGEVFLFLNPDTLIVDNAVASMYEFLINETTIGAIGPIIYDESGNIQLYCGRKFPDLLTEIFKHTALERLFPKSRLFGRYLMTYWGHRTTHEVDLIQGSCMMIPRRVVEKVGKMDTRFFLFGDDVEWCYRIKKAGYKILMYAPAEIIHKGGKSTESCKDVTRILGFDSMYKFFKIHYGELIGILYRISMFIVFGIKAIIGIFTRSHLTRLRYRIALWALGMLKFYKHNMAIGYKIAFSRKLINK